MHKSADSIIFVFGSNLAGRHGRGAASDAAVYWSAKHGTGRGRTGQAYAIATKDAHMRALPLAHIALDIHQFLSYAEDHPELDFQVTRIGCGLAGYTDKEIAPLFRGATSNCHLPLGWLHYW